MMVAVMVLAAMLPAVAWLLLFYRSDRYQREPRRLVARTFLVGGLVGLAFAFAYSGPPFVRSALMMAVLVAPLVEETAKFLVVKWTVYGNPAFDEPVDGMVYAAAAALGFASVENAVYVVSGYMDAGAGGAFYVMAGRSVLSVPAHALFSSVWGLAMAWQKGRSGVRPVVVVAGALLAGMAMHSAFNYLVGARLLGGLAFLLALGLAWRGVFLLIRRALADSPYAPGEGR
jgi:RsiW-degrading membrane proteinase PrsW (M82 family)